jgi:hypothetical protein
MERAVAKARSEDEQMYELFFEKPPKDIKDIPHSIKDFVKDQVFKDLDVPWHQIKPEQVKMWRDMGFQPVEYEKWWHEPATEEFKRKMKMMGGASLRKYL